MRIPPQRKVDGLAGALDDVLCAERSGGEYWFASKALCKTGNDIPINVREILMSRSSSSAGE